MSPSRPERHSPALAEELYRLVGRSRRRLWLTAARALEARGESIFTWQIVSFVTRHGPSTQRDLAYAVAQHPAGISRQVDAIERQGLVRRRRVADYRRLLVEPTDEGRAWMERVSTGVMDEVSRVMGALGETDRRALAELLRRLLASVESHPEATSPPAPEKRARRGGSAAEDRGAGAPPARPRRSRRARG